MKEELRREKATEATEIEIQEKQQDQENNSKTLGFRMVLYYFTGDHWQSFVVVVSVIQQETPG